MNLCTLIGGTYNGKRVSVPDHKGPIAVDGEIYELGDRSGPTFRYLAPPGEYRNVIAVATPKSEPDPNAWGKPKPDPGAWRGR